jgi:hypothetical protein
MYPSACQRQRCGPTQVNARPIGHLPRARVVVLGASGNSGTSLLRALAYDHQVSSVLAVSRRRAALELPKTDWAQADIAEDELTPLFRGGRRRRASGVVDPAVAGRTAPVADERRGVDPPFPRGRRDRRARARLRLVRRRLRQGPKDGGSTRAGRRTASARAFTRATRPRSSANSTDSSASIPVGGWCGCDLV